MVSIRLQRTGRRRHAQFRVVVQDSHRTPTSGRVIANLGFYNPHTKEHGVDLEKATVYLNNGAQPSERLVRFFTDQKVDLPPWVKASDKKSKQIKHPEKLRRNQTAVTVAEEPVEAEPPAEVTAESEEQPVEPTVETDVEVAAEPKAEEEPTEKDENEESAEEDSEPDAGEVSEEETDSKPDSGE